MEWSDYETDSLSLIAFFQQTFVYSGPLFFYVDFFPIIHSVTNFFFTAQFMLLFQCTLIWRFRIKKDATVKNISILYSQLSLKLELKCLGVSTMSKYSPQQPCNQACLNDIGTVVTKT